jgi:hypothetical protein
VVVVDGGSTVSGSGSSGTKRPGSVPAARRPSPGSNPLRTAVFESAETLVIGAGRLNGTTGAFSSARFMNACHVRAGHVPPVTAGTPLIGPSDRTPSRWPIQTAVDSCGV